MNSRLKELTRGFSMRSGATDSSLNEVMSNLGYKLPKEYLDFMRYSNGGEGTIGENSYLVIWPIEEIIPLNQESAIREEYPHLLIFGSNAATGKYAFDTRSENMAIVEIDDYDPSIIFPHGQTFLEFLEQLKAE